MFYSCLINASGDNSTNWADNIVRRIGPNRSSPNGVSVGPDGPRQGRGHHRQHDRRNSAEVEPQVST